MNKLQVKEHLRNGALYEPVVETSLSEDWKNRLIRQYTLHKQLNAAMQENTGILKPLVYIGVPVTCLLLVFASYLGFISPREWCEKIILATNFDLMQIGLKEIFLFAALVNALTLLIRRRGFPFLL